MKLTALQELENCALARMVDIYNGKVMTFDRTTQYKNIHKSLQALEIIKEKDVSMYWLRHSKNVNDYNNFIIIDKRQYQKLTQEEFDLLKEVLL